MPAGLKRHWKRLERALANRDQVDRIAPHVGFLHPLAQRVTARKTRAHWLGEIARAVIERLERIVGEVQNMTCGQVAMVRSGGEHQAASTGASAPARTGGGYAALGTLAVALYTFGLGQDRLTD